MGIESRYIHRVSVERLVAGAQDAWGAPTQAWSTVAARIPACVMAKSAREVARLTQGGPVVATFTIYMAPRDITAADRVRMDPADGRLFQLTGVRNILDHHLEIDAQVIA